jgi:hypothetical protein
LLLSSLLGVATNAGTQEALVSDLTREEMEQFLLRAEVVDIRSLSVGVTGSRRATLSDGKRTHDAHVQTVDIFNKKFTAGKKTEYNFRDYYGYNIAAYCLDKLLGLNMVPVSVKRRIRGDEGSVSWWVDGALMSGLEYKEGGHKPPDIGRFNDQKLQGWAFQQLVQNRDPNLGNFVIDKNWKVWMIDFTRAFRQWKQLDDVERLNRIPRGFLDRLRQLDPADVRRDLRPYLTKGELKGLLARREKLLEHFDRLIAEKGETAVLVDRSGS